jgi:plastocyanin
MHSSIAILSILAASALAKTISVYVGKGGLVFSPDTIAADVGDVVEFHFFGSIHTAVQGDFSTPCAIGSLKGTGFNSGPVNNNADGTVRLVALHMIAYYFSTHFYDINSSSGSARKLS